MRLSNMAENLIGSEIIKLAGEINERIALFVLIWGLPACASHSRAATLRVRCSLIPSPASRVSVRGYAAPSASLALAHRAPTRTIGALVRLGALVAQKNMSSVVGAENFLPLQHTYPKNRLANPSKS